jgi:hypothetical protein
MELDPRWRLRRIWLRGWRRRALAAWNWRETVEERRRRVEDEKAAAAARQKQAAAKIRATLSGSSGLPSRVMSTVQLLAGLGPGSPSSELEAAKARLMRDLGDGRSGGFYHSVLESIAKGTTEASLALGAYLHAQGAPSGQGGCWFTAEAKRLGYRPVRRWGGLSVRALASAM